MHARRLPLFFYSIVLASLFAAGTLLAGPIPEYTPADPPEYIPEGAPDFIPDYPFGDLVNPYMDASPGSQVVRTGDPVTLRVDVAELGEVGYQWQKDGIAVPGATESTLTLPAVDRTDSGTYSVRITIGETTQLTSTAYFAVSSPTLGDGNLLNISTRGLVGTGQSVMIGGFVIEGSEPRTVAITAKGPSLAAFGINNAIADPQITLYRGQQIIGTNDSLSDLDPIERDAIILAGIAPTDPSEPAMAVSLDPGPYTVRVTNNAGAEGVGLIEVFDWDLMTGNAADADSRLLNISTRGIVGSGQSVMIGGFVINGTEPKAVAIIAKGPSLAAFGITNAITDPAITLRRGQDVIAQNDDTAALPMQNRTMLAQGGLLPTDLSESALLATLEPGAYTVVLQNNGASDGVGIVEVYDWDRIAP
jgi:hypothetical protein